MVGEPIVAKVMLAGIGHGGRDRMLSAHILDFKRKKREKTGNAVWL